MGDLVRGKLLGLGIWLGDRDLETKKKKKRVYQIPCKYKWSDKIGDQ